MIAQLIWIIAIYASAAALVQLLHHREETRAAARTGKRLHYILITRNHEAVVEWYLRVFVVHAYWIGKPLRVTLVDDGSEDRTMAVASRMAYYNSSIEFAPAVPLYGLADRDTLQGVTVDLRVQEPLLPLRMMRLPGSGSSPSKHGE
ncbi:MULTISPECIES: glycosyltransferase family A protein [unclassified Paenibacillus]|uniref:glycosyltransferase family A protein n=1 Tax=unclassified Paenibacillus TaxID=185978 RepID=UPI0030FCF5B4